MLCSISPFQLNPNWPTPPASPVLKFPQIQLLLTLEKSAPVQMLTPPAPAGVPENNSSPVEALLVIILLCMFRLMFSQYGNCVFAGNRLVLICPAAGVKKEAEAGAFG